MSRTTTDDVQVSSVGITRQVDLPTGMRATR